MHEILTKDQLLKPTWVPTPPSKSKTHVEHDSRVLDVLNALKKKEPDVDVRELVIQTGDREQAKKTNVKRDVESLYRGFAINENLGKPDPKLIIIFDDVVTTGASFRAMERCLIERFPSATVIGLFPDRRT